VLTCARSFHHHDAGVDMDVKARGLASVSAHDRWNPRKRSETQCASNADEDSNTRKSETLSSLCVAVARRHPLANLMCVRCVLCVCVCVRARARWGRWYTCEHHTAVAKKQRAPQSRLMEDKS
jgi:hypothetical protein